MFLVVVINERIQFDADFRSGEFKVRFKSYD